MMHKWERNTWTGNDICDIAKHVRVIRFKWDGKYVYCAEHSTAGNLVRGTLAASMVSALKGLKKALASA